MRKPRRRLRRPNLADIVRRANAFTGSATFILYLATSLLRRGAPRPVGVDERLRSLACDNAPLRDDVTIYWDDHHIPFVEARNDADLAVALGIVHAHLRLTQIDFMRRIALGRLSEVLGPMAVASDQALRMINFRRAGAEVEKVLPAKSRAWLENFTTGINWHIDNLEILPHEFQVLGMRPERWQLSDLLAVSRLASMDFTWKVWMRLLKLRRRPDWDELWERLMTEPAMQPPSVAGGGLHETALGALGRGGSNSYAVASSRSATGSALIANDPHLSITMPNNWLIAGFKSPGFHAVGLMVPGVPIMGLGRNPWIAWGGTSLHGASSELVDVSSQGKADIKVRRETINVRWGRKRRIRIRESRLGPIVSDARLLRMARHKPVALHWMGHRGSDEVTPFLKIAAARSWDDFLSALNGYAIPGLNMIYADQDGRVGQAIAATLPRRPQGSPSDIVSDAEALRHWESFVSSHDLPHVVDPPEGFVASANNAPPPTDVSLSLFFSPDDRVRRLRQVLSTGDRFSVADLTRLQTDVASLSAIELRDRLLPYLNSHYNGPDANRAAGLVAELRDWDGDYRVQSAGALAYELFVYHVVVQLHGTVGARLYAATWDIASLLRRDLDQVSDEVLNDVVRRAVVAAAKPFARLGHWGNAHRLRLEHAFALLPGLGRRYVYAEHAVGGSNETLMKSAHGFAGGRHRVRFGANARHISDLGDLDANYFVLLGGQDGWLGSSTFVDQLDPWERGAHVRVPLRVETVRAQFRHQTRLSPKRRS